MQLNVAAAVALNPEGSLCTGELRTPERRAVNKSHLLACPVVQRAAGSQSSLDYKPLIIPKVDFKLFSGREGLPGRHLLHRTEGQRQLALQGSRKRQARRFLTRLKAETGTDLGTEVRRFKAIIKAAHRFGEKKMYKLPPLMRRIERVMQGFQELVTRSPIRKTGRSMIAPVYLPPTRTPLVSVAANRLNPRRLRVPLFPFENSQPQISTARKELTPFDFNNFPGAQPLRLVPFPIPMPKRRGNDRTVGRTSECPDLSRQKGESYKDQDCESNLFSHACRSSKPPSHERVSFRKG